MQPPGETEPSGMRNESLPLLAPAADRHVQGGVAIGEERERIDEVLMPLHRVEVSDRDRKPIRRAEPQLVAQRHPFRRLVPHAIGNRDDPRSSDPEVPAKVVWQRGVAAGVSFRVLDQLGFR